MTLRRGYFNQRKSYMYKIGILLRTQIPQLNVEAEEWDDESVSCAGRFKFYYSFGESSL